jgi:hypothetical protein
MVVLGRVEGSDRSSDVDTIVVIVSIAAVKIAWQNSPGKTDAATVNHRIGHR